MRRIVTGIAAGALFHATLGLSSAALAQSAPEENIAPPHPTETMEQSKNAGEVNGVPAASVSFMTAQQEGDWLASSIIGQPVLNSARETVGEINDLINNAQGQVIGVVIGVGGFLGIGEKNVAVKYENVVVTRNDDGTIEVFANLTKETLTNAPAYQELSEQGVVRDENGDVKHTY